MPTRTFSTSDLDHFLLVASVFEESRGRGRNSEQFDIVFQADDDKLYHVVIAVPHDLGPFWYPAAYDNAVECPEVELYTTWRPVVRFRKVPDKVLT